MLYVNVSVFSFSFYKLSKCNHEQLKVKYDTMKERKRHISNETTLLNATFGYVIYRLTLNCSLVLWCESMQLLIPMFFRLCQFTLIGVLNTEYQTVKYHSKNLEKISSGYLFLCRKGIERFV
jgi:hypothetical protein